MIPQFEYINESYLSAYLSAAEGGLRDSQVKKITQTTDLGGKAGTPIVSGQASRVSGEETTVSMSDYVSARFTRFLEYADQNSEKIGWQEITQPDLDFPELALGDFIKWECDVYAPDIVGVFQQGNPLTSLIGAMNNLLPAAKTLNLNTKGLPSLDEMNAVGTFINSVELEPVLLGEDEDCEYQVIARLDKKFITGNISEIDNRFILVGKISKKIASGRWYPLMPFEGLTRQQRREAEKNGPRTPEQESNFVKGPAVVVDLLALYK